MIRGWLRRSACRRCQSPEAKLAFLAAAAPFATGLANLRRLLVLPNGDVLVAEQFPPEYKGSLFVALKGSWNRSIPTDYKVVRVPFKDGRPEGDYENFATGFWISGEERAEVWGRPAALAVAKDGSLLVADDTGGTIWHISYNGTAEHAAAPAETTGSEAKTRAAGE